MRKIFKSQICFAFFILIFFFANTLGFCNKIKCEANHRQPYSAQPVNERDCLAGKSQANADSIKLPTGLTKQGIEVSQHKKISGCIEVKNSDLLLYIKDKMFFGADINKNFPSSDTSVSYFVELPDGKVEFCGITDFNDASNVVWAPSQLGLHKSWCELGDCKSREKEFYVVPRKWHFNHWWAMPNQKWMTSALMHGKSQNWDGYINRGITPLAWKNGYNWSKTKGNNDYVSYWGGIKNSKIKGVMIDEFHGAEEDNEMMGVALQVLRESEKECFIVPYKDGFINPKAKEEIKGFGVSDLVLMECYASDWRSYDKFDSYESALKAGIQENAVICLGLKSWITTEKELRRQIEYIRTKWPKMPGLAFFHKGSDFMMHAVDRAIYDYYLAPVLLLKIDKTNSIVRVHNIGSLPARRIIVDFNDRKGSIISKIDRIDPQQFKSISLKEGFGSVSIRKDPNYTVIDYKKPIDLSRPDKLESEQAKRYMQKYTERQAETPLQNMAPHVLANSDGIEKKYIFDMPEPTLKKSVGLSFDVQLGQMDNYGSVGVCLNGESSSLGFEWQHQEIDTDLPLNVPRAVFKSSWGKGFVAMEAIPYGLNCEDGKYTFFAAYNAVNDTARGILSEKESGVIIWDTGDLSVEEGFKFGELVCYVGPDNCNSLIERDSVNGVNRIIVSSPDIANAQKTYIDNVSVFYDDE